VSNLDFWNEVCKTNPAHTKKAKIGTMNITAICPQHQRKNATEAFGMYGDKWGIVPGSESYQILDFEENTKLCLYQGTFFYYNRKGNRAEFPISSNVKVQYFVKNKGYYKIDDDFAKKAQTDALTKGLSFLGFNSDVFEGLFDDNKYVSEVNEQFAAEESQQSILDNLGKDVVDHYQSLVSENRYLDLFLFLQNYPTIEGQIDERLNALYNSWPKGQKTKMKKLHGELQSLANKDITHWAQQIEEASVSGDEEVIREYWDESSDFKKFILPRLSDNAQQYLKQRAESKTEDEACRSAV
jgi:hypothetical protein